MNCPVCAAPTRVLESRPAGAGAAVRRRRECTGCGQRRTSFERFEEPRPYVRKRDGSRQAFDRAKLRAALLRATHKRAVRADDVERIVVAIEAEAEAGGELDAERIAELVLARLRELDRGALLQFAGTLPDPIPQIAGSPSE